MTTSEIKKSAVALLLTSLILILSGCVAPESNVDPVKQSSLYTSEDVVIGKGTEWELQGLLTIPSNADQPCPAVVLVHGSGPSDMDETIYGNKPFLDIADYLSSNGIAVIRYDKRTLTYGSKMVRELGGNLTVYEETIEDAILAAEILKSDPRVNENKVFVLGHSMGGMLAPRIHAEGGNFAGIVSLAGSPRSIHEIMYDQQIALAEAMPEGKEKTDTLALLDKEQYDAAVTEMLSLSDEEAKNTPLQGGTSAYYYKDWDKTPVSDYFNEIDIPLLILQGSADFQIFPFKDFTAWKGLLTNRENVTFKLYDGLNHLFMMSTGRNITDYTEEYRIVSHVDSQVLSDISEWITAH